MVGKRGKGKPRIKWEDYKEDLAAGGRRNWCKASSIESHLSAFAVQEDRRSDGNGNRVSYIIIADIHVMTIFLKFTICDFE